MEMKILLLIWEQVLHVQCSHLKQKKNKDFYFIWYCRYGLWFTWNYGAFFGDKTKLPICITGDGGLMFNFKSFRHLLIIKIPVKIFIINNGGYLTMKLMQKKISKNLLALIIKAASLYQDF